MAIEFASTAWGHAATQLEAPGFPARPRAYAGDAGDEFFPGERIGAPPRRRSRIKTAILVLTLAGAGYALWQTTAMWRPWVTAASDRIITEWERQKSAKANQMAPALAAPQPLAPLAITKDVAAVTGTALNPPGAEPVSPAIAPVEPAPPQDPPQTAAPVPLPKPQIDPDDPYQKRAAAIGLHPQISSAVLSSLSDADYRNAGTAIRKALAEASDTEKFVWPRKPASNAAIFQVHFVTGDRTDCRRYIVTVLKNGWTTTAPPMEKCGVAPPKRSAQAERSIQRAPL